MKHIRAYVAVVLAALAAVLYMAYSASSVSAQAVAQSYVAAKPLQVGMIVQLDNDKKVSPITQAAADKVQGIVVRPNDAPLSLEQSGVGEQVYVASTGNYQVLVSNQNGAIKEGDYVVVSALEGIGMKASTSSQYVVGRAISGFDGVQNVLGQDTVKDSNGHELTVKFGYVVTDITVRRNPAYEAGSSVIPGFLQHAVDSIAKKSVSPVRIYLSAAVALAIALIVSSILYAGIRTSLIALGRNPLARQSIFRNLMQVVLVGVIILVGGLFAVYLILKL